MLISQKLKVENALEILKVDFWIVGSKITTKALGIISEGVYLLQPWFFYELLHGYFDGKRRKRHSYQYFSIYCKKIMIFSNFL